MGELSFVLRTGDTVAQTADIEHYLHFLGLRGSISLLETLFGH